MFAHASRNRSVQGAAKLFAVSSLVILVAMSGDVTSVAASPGKPSITRAPFGTVDGQNVDLFTLTNSRRMCSCGKPSVWPVSWRTTRWNSESSVVIVNASRFMVGSLAGMLRMSVPK